MRIWMKLPNLLEKIRNIHGIEFLDYDISFKGICPKCREKNSKENGGKRDGSKQILSLIHI